MYRFFVFFHLLFLSLAPTCSAQFDTIINVPPDKAPQQIFNNTQLNVFASGSLPDGFMAGTTEDNENIEVNIFNGIVGDGFVAQEQTDVNVFGGEIGDDFVGNRWTTINVAGGTVGERFTVGPNSRLNISGGTFGNDFFLRCVLGQHRGRFVWRQLCCCRIA